MFVDECTIDVVAGRGGDGCVSFRREKFIPRGGPDGGDGGHGGSVFLRVNPHRRTLSHLRHTPSCRAGAGEAGRGKQMTGACGEDALVEVPPGTVVQDAATGEWIADATEAGSDVVLARGGRGGRGNQHFKRPDRRAPRVAEKGKPAEARRLHLTLKLLADVGLIGLPNAGKSTLLSRLSNARPKIADYPFTTLAPVLGIVPVGDFSSLVLADLPGLIEGAAEGRGLGQRFLRHIERTRILLILIEAVDAHPVETHAALLGELRSWSKELETRETLVCYSKADLLTREERGGLPQVGARSPLLISAHTGEGLRELVGMLSRLLAEMPSDPTAAGAAETAGGAAIHGTEAVAAIREEDAPLDRGARPWPTRWVIPQRPGACRPRTNRQEVGP